VPDDEDAVDNPSALEVVRSAAAAIVPTSTVAVDLNGFGTGSLIEHE
jgi:hypothetical protein